MEGLRLVGSIAAAKGNPSDAARLLGAGRGALDRAGKTHTTFSAVVGEPDTSELRDTLGEAAFDAAWAEGVALSLEDALAFATRARGSRGRPSLGWDSLTPTELAVDELVADGLTNKQIAERQFLSAGTIKTHLAHVFAKLDMANRADVAAEVAGRRSNGAR